MQTAQRLLLAEKRRDVKHSRTLAYSDKCKTESVHHVAELIALFLHPCENFCLLIFYREIVKRAEQLSQLAHDNSRILLPTLAHCLLIILRRRNEEERTKLPQFMYKVNPVLHHCHHLRHTFKRLVHAVACNDRRKETCYLLIRLAEDVLVVEPYTFLIVKPCSCLAAFRYVELLYKLVDSKQFLLRTRVPAQQGKEVDDSLGEVSAFTEAAAYLACLGVVPLKREYGKSETVAVAF